jgi:hypothetical protein
LVYSNTKEIIVTSVCEKTKWKYWWKNDYVVEVTKYEFWDLSNDEKTKTKPGIDILLSRELSPPNVSFGVTVSKKFFFFFFKKKDHYFSFYELIKFLFKYVALQKVF